LIQLKKVLAVAAIAVAAIAPIKAIAGSDSVICVSKGRGFNTNSLNDGTFCEVDSETGGKSTAKASSGGSASADDFMFGKATATSSHGATTEADASFPKGKAKATGSGAGSSATAISSQCSSTAMAQTGGTALANCATGKATATASDGGSADAESKFVTNCVVKATSTGMGSMSTANCEKAGGFVTITTANGGVASGNGVDPPICTPGGGTATVKSSGGDC